MDNFLRSYCALPWVCVGCIIGFSFPASGEVILATYKIESTWPDGFAASLTFPADREFHYGWLLYILFDIPVHDFEVFEGTLAGQHLDGRLYVILPMQHNFVLHIDSTGKRSIRFHARAATLPNAQALFVAMLDEYETVEEALNRATGGVISETITVPRTTIRLTTATTTTVAMPDPKPVTVPWWLEEYTFTPATSSNGVTSTTPTTTTTTPPTLAKLNFRYNLRDVITKSIRFFEAQRSGLLPEDNRITWRSHSMLRDGLDVGIDLSGGYYIDGGFIKYGYPMAFSTTMLAWGILEFRDSYIASKQLFQVMNVVRWATDYFVKCHTQKHEFYAQVSTPAIDNAYWGRPEDFSGRRPSYKITSRNPGSELVAEAAAALAASYLVFRGSRPEYAGTLLDHAKQLYKFAERYRGRYDVSIPHAGDIYSSEGYFDELAWAACWLHRATGDHTYLEKAQVRLAQSTDENARIRKFDWNDKRIAVNLMLARSLPNQMSYLNTMTEFCLHMQPGGGAAYTPKGLLYLNADAPSMHAANVGFICLLAGKFGVLPKVMQLFAHRQLSYLLGDGGRSFVVGFGKNSPTRPYHRSSSCPDSPAVCSWDERRQADPNPQVLYGALLPGPDRWDSFEGDRRDSIHDRVSLVYNAGLQNLAAGILQLQISGQTFSDPNPEELTAAVSRTFAIQHDYAEVLRKSLLFYAAQRAGEVPNDYRVAWRRSAFVRDRGEQGEDLSGGYFDGSGYVKFNFPMAFTTTVLSWGVLAYKEAYRDANELENVYTAIRTATDYFISCHPSKFVLYGQVGNSQLDNMHWTTPEGMDGMARPAYKLDHISPGSDLAAETAAALAAGSLVLADKDPNYSQVLLQHARDLFEFADKYRELYHRSIPDAAKFYRSLSGYEDELVWAAAWLFIATGEQEYISKKAERYYHQFKLADSELSKGFYWDEKTAGVQVLLAQTTGRSEYREAVVSFCDRYLPDNTEARYTPHGLLYIDDTAPLRAAAGVAFICLRAADLGFGNVEQYRDMAKKQIQYILGGSGLGSYVVGYGPTPPTRARHRGSSCPLPPHTCDLSDLHKTGSNPQVLYGAVVGGPDEEDQFTDNRMNYRSNRVALDHNACFQSTVAGLKHLQLHPPTTTTPATTTTTTTASVDDSYDVTLMDDIDAAYFEDFTIDESIDYLGFEQTTAQSIVTTEEISASTATQALMTDHTTDSPITTTNSVNELSQGGFGGYNSTVFTHTSISETTGQTTVPTTTVASNSRENSTTVSTDVTTVLDTTTRPRKTSIPAVQKTKPGKRTGDIFPTIPYGQGCRARVVFDACAIKSEDFPSHPLRKFYTCRFHAFKGCAKRLSRTCRTDIWSEFLYWNSEIETTAWFSDQDLECVDRRTQARQQCLVSELLATFKECSIVEQPIGDENCWWRMYKTCVNEKVGHCTQTWVIWKQWKSGYRGKIDFNPTCNSERSFKISLTLLFSLLCTSLLFII